MKPWFLLIFSLCVALCSCNRENRWLDNNTILIEFDSADGVYAVRPDQEFTIYAYVDGIGSDAKFIWTLDNGTVIGTDRNLSWQFAESGTYYVTLTVASGGASAQSQARVEVAPSAAPTISLAIGSDGLTLELGSSAVIAPRYQYADGDDFAVSWSVDGTVMSHERNFEFLAEKLGNFAVEVTASNIDGSASHTVMVHVVEHLQAHLFFTPTMWGSASTTRYTFAHRPVCLYPQVALASVDSEQWQWSVDGVPADCQERMFVFTPTSAGSYNISVSNGGAAASVEVVCVDGSELNRQRTSGTISDATQVLAYIPAPGQFIGDDSAFGGMPPLSTLSQANAWALERLNAQQTVSLGSWGGYIIVGFDHSITTKTDGYDFLVGGNAITTNNEPGIVWVAQDVNGNGLPDDEFYELRGSEFGAPTTVQNYSATYYRPGGEGMDVVWRDCFGTYGAVEYIYSQHKQPYYYPQWIDASSYTLYGTRLAAHHQMNAISGLWSNDPLSWGYADNLGSDKISAGSADGGGQTNGFHISNAVMANGQSIKLQYVDFIKIQSGTMGQSGILGEISTEITRISDR